MDHKPQDVQYMYKYMYQFVKQFGVLFSMTTYDKLRIEELIGWPADTYFIAIVVTYEICMDY